MHQSYFMWLQASISVPAQELSLSNEASEWLFHAGYWRLLSAEHSLRYEQYEEEVMPQAQIPSAVEKLTAATQDIQASRAGAVRFTYGWDANRQPLECVTTTEALSNELARLQGFLEGARASNLDVYCQL